MRVTRWLRTKGTDNMMPHGSRKGGRAALLLLGVSWCVAPGCESSKPQTEVPLAPPEAIPASLEVPGGDVELGSVISSLRDTTRVSRFRIARYPVTVADYRKCVEKEYCLPPSLASGACDPLWRERGDGPTYESGESNIPVTCVKPSEAVRYCRWIGGRLPTIAELLMASRGPKVQRFPWGSSPPSCERSWRVAFAPDLPGACCGSACSDLTARVVGAHETGASPFGVEDVLSTQAEMAVPVRGTTIGGCGPNDGACVVAGMEPGALDWFRGIPAEGNHQAPRHSAGFRCAFEEGGR